MCVLRCICVSGDLLLLIEMDPWTDAIPLGEEFRFGA